MEALWTQELFRWGLGLALGVPILILVLGELAERLERRGNPLAEGVRQLRHIVLPTLALLLIMWKVVGIAGEESSAQMVETLFWLTVIYAALTFVRNLGQLGTANPSAWVTKVPTLAWALARGAVLFVILSHIFSGIWGVDLSKLGTVLGVGSLAIGLALQDTISNLVSGFLMLADRPFQVGDWVGLDGRWMTVESIGWRTSRLRNYNDYGEVIIPNGTLANKEIINYRGQVRGTRYYMIIPFYFSYDDPPYRVKQVLMDVLMSRDYIIKEPAPVVLFWSYHESSIEYKCQYYIDFWDFFDAWDEVQAQIYYAAKRNGLTFARPAEVHYRPQDLRQQVAPQDIADKLRANSLFASLDTGTLDQLVTGTTVKDYGVGEFIVTQGQPDDGFYVINTGAVTVSVKDGAGENLEIDRLKGGDFFGELALLRNEPSPISVTATADANVLVVDGNLITQLIDQNPQFALEMNFYIEKRRTTLNAFSGVQNGNGNHSARQEWVSTVQGLQ